MKRSLWSRIVGASLIVVGCLAAATPSHGQGFGGMGGMGGGGMGGTMPANALPLKIVILLGPDFQFDRKPFVNVPDLMPYFLRKAYRVPSQDDISLDMSLTIPAEREMHVAAITPAELGETELATWKREARLQALRFGVQHVSFLPSQTQVPEGQSSVWLQAPVGYVAHLGNPSHGGSVIDRYVTIAHGLAESAGGGKYARIDLFHSPEMMRQQARNDPFADTDPFGGDPFAGSSDDPFGGSFEDPFGARSKPVEDSNDGINDSPQQHQQEAEQGSAEATVQRRRDRGRAQGEKLRAQFMQQKKYLEAQMKTVKNVEARREVLMKIDANQMEWQQLQIEELEIQLQKLRDSLDAMRQPDAVKQRVEAKLKRKRSEPK